MSYEAVVQDVLDATRCRAKEEGTTTTPD